MTWETPVAIGAVYVIADACRAYDIYRSRREADELDANISRLSNDAEIEKGVKKVNAEYRKVLEIPVIGPCSLVAKEFVRKKYYG